MIIHISARIEKEHKYAECERKLANTHYLLYSIGMRLFADVEVDSSNLTQDRWRAKIEEDLMNLGLQCESVMSMGVV